MKITPILLTSIITICAGVPLTAKVGQAAPPEEVSKDIIAVQIRKQGFECKNPESATRDPAASKPDDAAWILACEGVTYKVTLIPNMAAKVERLPDDQKNGERP